MIQWLKDNHGNRASVHANERFELNFLRDEVSRLTEELGIDEEDAQSRGSEMVSEESDDDYVDELPAPIPNKPKKPRNSVSAEAYGEWNSKEDFTPTVIAKSDIVKGKIKTRLCEAFMFSAVSASDLEIVMDAMDEHKVKAGDVVIKEGDDGDVLYVIEEGSYKCTKVFSGNTEPTYLKTYQPGEAFGELALLYNAPRAATITAEGDGVLYSLDRNTFNHIVKDAAAKKRERYEEFLSQVKLLTAMDPYERSKLADAFTEQHFEAGDFVIKEGETGSVFYFIQNGDAVATKTIEAGKAPVEVMQYATGDYFGERALIQNEPRAANVVAKSTLDVVSMDRHSFKRLMGPIEEILKRNMDVYNQYC